MLDVAFALAFLFFALASVCSFLQERISSIFSLRQRILYRALSSMLDANEDPLALRPGFFRRVKDDPLGTLLGVDRRTNTVVDALLRDPLIRPLRGRGWFGITLRKAPSYLPREFFVQAAKRLGGNLSSGMSEDAFKIVNQLDERELGDWYDATMERAQGWYRRQTQVSLLVVATVVVVLFNVDALAVANALLRADTTRQVVALEAQQALDSGTAPSLASLKDLIRETGVVFGMEVPACPSDPPANEWLATCYLRAFVGHLGTASEHGVGWLISILAGAVGAPFWFDLLSRIANLRASGKPQGSAIRPRQKSEVEVELEAHGRGDKGPKALNA